jgi:hypothetical protein
MVPIRLAFGNASPRVSFGPGVPARRPSRRLGVTAAKREGPYHVCADCGHRLCNPCGDACTKRQRVASSSGATVELADQPPAPKAGSQQLTVALQQLLAALQAVGAAPGLDGVTKAAGHTAGT